MKFLEFFQETQGGKLSNNRLGRFLILGGFAADYIMHIIRNVEFNPSLSIVGIIIGIVGLSLVQKKQEEK